MMDAERRLGGKIRSSMARSSPSLCNINDVLYHHLLVEILVRVPLKEKFRCRCVCKLWLSTLRDNPLSVRRFIAQLVSEEVEEDNGRLIPVEWNEREMVLVASSCKSHTASDFSLDFLPLNRDLPPCSAGFPEVLASSNGLLLCSPNNTPSVEYYICNPLTKQWLALPPPPRQERCVGIGLICDPFYNVHDDGRYVTLNDRLGVKLVRMVYTDSEYGVAPDLFVDTFSSLTGWSTVQSEDGIVNVLHSECLVPYNGKVYQLISDCDLLVYDFNTNEFLVEHHGLPSEELYLTNGSIKFAFPFKGLSVCRGSLWIGQSSNSRLRVFKLTDGVWRLEHDVDTHTDMGWSSFLLLLTVLDGIETVLFRTMHPSDPMVAYVSVGCAFIECNFRDSTMNVLSEPELHEWNSSSPFPYWCNVVTCSAPLWPAPLPALSTS